MIMTMKTIQTNMITTSDNKEIYEYDSVIGHKILYET